MLVFLIICLLRKKKPETVKKIDLEEVEKENLLNYRVEGGQEKDQVKNE